MFLRHHMSTFVVHRVTTRRLQLKGMCVLPGRSIMVDTPPTCRNSRRRHSLYTQHKNNSHEVLPEG